MREMKDSGVEWIGEIPSEWSCSKIKYMSTISSGTAISKEEYEENGFFPIYGANGVVGWCNKKNNNNECLVTGRVGSIGFIHKASEAWITDNALIILTSSETKDFLYYAMMLLDYNHMISGTAMPLITAGNLYKQIIPTTTNSEMKRIASFLDTKCAEIDSISEDIRKEIETLQEYRKSVITEAVTKGLNPDVEMKDSGVEWIGHIPSHWNINRGKYIFEYLQKPVKDTDEVITCFRDGEVTLRRNRREEGYTFSDKEIGYQGIDVGDLVVHGMDGFAGAIGISDSRGKGSPVLNVLGTDQNKKYYMYYLRAMAFTDVFTATATGIRVRSCDLRWNKLAEFPYPVPSIEEQNCIAVFLDSKCAEIDIVINDKQKQLDTLEEYRKSLIYEYVTGKKEVPTT